MPDVFQIETLRAELSQFVLRPEKDSVLLVRVDTAACDPLALARLLDELQKIRPRGLEWRDLQIPILVLGPDVTLEQIDAATMREWGWSRLDEEDGRGKA